MSREPRLLAGHGRGGGDGVRAVEGGATSEKLHRRIECLVVETAMNPASAPASA